MTGTRRTALLVAAAAALFVDTFPLAAAEADPPSNGLRGGAGSSEPRTLQGAAKKAAAGTGTKKAEAGSAAATTGTPRKKALNPEERRKKNNDHGGAAGPGGQKKKALAAASEGAAGGDKSMRRKRPGGTVKKNGGKKAGKKIGDDVRTNPLATAGPPGTGPPDSGGIMGAPANPHGSTYTAQGAAGTMTAEQAAGLAANRGNNDVDLDESDSEEMYGQDQDQGEWWLEDEEAAEQGGGASSAETGPNKVGAGFGNNNAQGGKIALPARRGPLLCGSLIVMQPINVNFCCRTAAPCRHKGMPGGACMYDEICDEYSECLDIQCPKRMAGANGANPEAAADPRTYRCVPSEGDHGHSSMTLCTTAATCDGPSDESGCGEGMECESFQQCKDYEPKKTYQDMLDEANAEAWLDSKKGFDQFQEDEEETRMDAVSQTPGAKNGAQMNSAAPGGALGGGTGSGMGGMAVPGKSMGIQSNPGPKGPLSNGQPSFSGGARVSGGYAGSVAARQQNSGGPGGGGGGVRGKPTFKCVDVSAATYDPCTDDLESCTGANQAGNEICHGKHGGNYEFMCVPANHC